MSIPDYMSPQRDFSAGEIDKAASRRDDTDIVRAGARRLSNWYLMLSGGFRRRPGSWLSFYGRDVIDRIEPAPGAIFDIEFRGGEFRARNEFGDLQILVAPWTTDQIYDLDWALYENRLIVTAQTMRPQVLEYVAADGSWTIRDFRFVSGVNGMLRQPFYSFAKRGTTFRPNSRAKGAVGTGTFDAPVLAATMVGTEFKWAGRRLKLSAFLSTTTGTFENLEELPPSYRVTMTSVDGYRLGDAVQGTTNNSRGQILAISTGTLQLDILVTERYDGFVNTETVVAQEAAFKVSGTPAVMSPFASSNWEEAFMSDYRGWPGSVSVDRQRLIFCDFRQLPGAVLESAIGEIEDFEVTADADGAIFEITPQRERALHVLGGADQFVFTTGNIYFIPISADNPLKPGSVEFRPIGTGGCSPLKPVATLSSILYMSADNKRVMALSQTGTNTQPYELKHLSRYHSKLIVNPVDMVISYGQDIDSGETLYVINEDGSVTVGRYDPAADFVGFVPWTIDGRVKSAAARQRTVKFACQRTLPNGTTVDTIEQMDFDLKLDCVIATSVPNGGADLAPFEGLTMHRLVNGLYTGQVLIGAGGAVSGSAVPAPTLFGFNFIPHFSPFAPNFDKGESSKQRLRRRKIKRAAVTVQNSGPFRINRTDLGGYRLGDNLGAPPPLRDATYVTSVQGRDYDPTYDLIQNVPYGLEIIEVGMEVTS